MIEAERIIEKGKIKREFLAPEVRFDFEVNEKRKRIWAVSLDLLFEFSEVCKKYNLRWFMFFGSLLGAIRHGGFIPWDDDLDVAMPRSDYDKLLQLAKEFKSPYFLQTPYTDKGYWYSYAKLRNKETTSFSRGFWYQGYVQGISLDIFCIDAWDMEGGEERFAEIKNLIIQNSNYMKSSNPHFNAYLGTIDELEPMAIKNYEQIQMLATSCRKDTDYVSLPVFTLYGYVKNVFKKRDFQNIITKKFEGFDVPVPVGYDRILTTIYGNYMKFPPIEKRGSWHSAYIEPDESYRTMRLKLIEKGVVL